MKKLSQLGYRLFVAATLALGLLAAVVAVIAAVLGSVTLVAVAVALLGLGAACLALTIHLHLRELLRVVLPAVERSGAPSQPVTAPLDDEVRDALLTLSQDAVVRRNNELHLLGALRRLESKESEPTR